MKLLTPQSSNAKLRKNSNVTDQWETSILYLAPADTAIKGQSICPASTEGCRKACLYSAGRGQMSSVQKARIRKTKLFLQRPVSFGALLVQDLERLAKRQKRTGVKQAVRLNGTSDISWERFQVSRNGKAYWGVPQAFPELQFYDYTKRPDRAIAATSQWLGQGIFNYHVTFSRSETNNRVLAQVAENKCNIAAVFKGPTLPETWKGLPVIDGTLHDMRFLDPSGVIVGLLPKGAAKKDTSGFVINT